MAKQHKNEQLKNKFTFLQKKLQTIEKNSQNNLKFNNFLAKDYQTSRNIENWKDLNVFLWNVGWLVAAVSTLFKEKFVSTQMTVTTLKASAFIENEKQYLFLQNELD